MSLGIALSRVLVLLVTVLAVPGMVVAQQTPSVGKVASGTPAIVEQPRPFGYVVGDLVTQRVLLTEFEPAMSPAAQRLSIWFERRTPRIESAPDGRRWLVVDYQLINAPQTPITVELPAWELKTKANKPLRIPAASIDVAPLISNSSAAAGGELRPDREVQLMPTAPTRVKFVIWSIALATVLAVWLAWLLWRNWRDSLKQPFAHALQELRRVDETTPEAWQALHHAFDRTAGRVLQMQTLPLLFQRAPHLQPLREQIERFFAQSSQRFFGAGRQGNFMSVRTLCSELRRIERRYAR